MFFPIKYPINKLAINPPIHKTIFSVPLKKSTEKPTTAPIIENINLGFPFVVWVEDLKEP